MDIRIVRRLTVLSMAILLSTAGPAAAHPPADSATYRWVTPPPSRAADNVAPEGRRATLPAGSPVQAFWTPDLQLTMEWPEHALGGDEVTIDVEPLDPTDLGPLPDRRPPNGNAYRIDLAPTGGFARPARLLLVVPRPGTMLFHSTDGRSWTRLARIETDAGTAGAALETGGYVLAAASNPDVAHGLRVTPKEVGGVLIAVAAAQLVHLVRSRRRSRSGPHSGLRGTRPAG